MPKMKTRKAAQKRYKITGTKKFKKRKSGLSHLLEHESSKAKRRKTGEMTVQPTDVRKIKVLLPYYKKG